MSSCQEKETLFYIMYTVIEWATSINDTSVALMDKCEAVNVGLYLI